MNGPLINGLQECCAWGPAPKKMLTCVFLLRLLIPVNSSFHVTWSVAFWVLHLPASLSKPHPREKALVLTPLDKLKAWEELCWCVYIVSLISNHLKLVLQENIQVDTLILLLLALLNQTSRSLLKESHTHPS